MSREFITGIFHCWISAFAQGEAAPAGEGGSWLSRFLKFWNFRLFYLGDHPVTVQKVIIAILTLIVGVFAVRRLEKVLRERLLPRTNLPENVASVIPKVFYYLGLFFTLLLALYFVNIPLTAFAFIGGALAIGIGFGAQNLINNFISGFIILIERPIKIGDMIEVEGYFARIEDIGARCTRIRTGDNIHILVPNSSFLEKSIINWTLSDRMVRTKVTVGVAYGTDVKRVKELLLEVARGSGDVLPSPEPFVVFEDFGDSALIFSLYFWIRLENLMNKMVIESRIRFAIDETFAREGIVIAFPQRDVHLDSVRPIEVEIKGPVPGPGDARGN
ncbi:MAG: mechanosensitive ion channel protein [Deltaproteobacteria bacterium]|nr:MAG: mechanosensitive ion channel protein [Deltaproteobacteria bacterium]